MEKFLSPGGGGGGGETLTRGTKKGAVLLQFVVKGVEFTYLLGGETVFARQMGKGKPCFGVFVDNSKDAPEPWAGRKKRGQGGKVPLPRGKKGAGPD